MPNAFLHGPWTLEGNTRCKLPSTLQTYKPGCVYVSMSACKCQSTGSGGSASAHLPRLSNTLRSLSAKGPRGLTALSSLNSSAQITNQSGGTARSISLL